MGILIERKANQRTIVGILIEREACLHRVRTCDLWACLWLVQKVAEDEFFIDLGWNVKMMVSETYKNNVLLDD